MRFSEAYSPGRAIEGGWSALKRAPAPLLIGAVLLAASSSQCGLEADDLRDAPRWAWEFLGIALVGGSLLSVLFFALQVFITPGYFRVARSALLGQPVPFEHLFAAGDRFLPMLLWQLLRAGILVVTAMALAVPLVPLGIVGGVAAIFGNGRWENWQEIGLAFAVLAFIYLLFVALPVFFYVEMGLYFGRFLVALEDKGPGDALRTSWRLAGGNRLWLFLYRVILFAVSVAGFFALFVGYFATRALADAGTVGAFLAYRQGMWPARTVGGIPGPASPMAGGPPPPPSPMTSPQGSTTRSGEPPSAASPPSPGATHAEAGPRSEGTGPAEGAPGSTGTPPEDRT